MAFKPKTELGDEAWTEAGQDNLERDRAIEAEVVARLRSRRLTQWAKRLGSAGLVVLGVAILPGLRWGTRAVHAFKKDPTETTIPPLSKIVSPPRQKAIVPVIISAANDQTGYQRRSDFAETLQDASDLLSSISGGIGLNIKDKEPIPVIRLNNWSTELVLQAGPTIDAAIQAALEEHHFDNPHLHYVVFMASETNHGYQRTDCDSTTGNTTIIFANEYDGQRFPCDAGSGPTMDGVTGITRDLNSNDPNRIVSNTFRTQLAIHTLQGILRTLGAPLIAHDGNDIMGNPIDPDDLTLDQNPKHYREYYWGPGTLRDITRSQELIGPPYIEAGLNAQYDELEAEGIKLAQPTTGVIKNSKEFYEYFQHGFLGVETDGFQVEVHGPIFNYMHTHPNIGLPNADWSSFRQNADGRHVSSCEAVTFNTGIYASQGDQVVWDSPRELGRLADRSPADRQAINEFDLTNNFCRDLMNNGQIVAD